MKKIYKTLFQPRSKVDILLREFAELDIIIY